MRRIAAVTGATGFVGGHVVRRFSEAGWRVRVLTRRLPVGAAFSAQAVDVVIGDLDDSAALASLVRGADVVVHSAGLIRAGSRLDYFAVNETGTRRLIEAVGAEATRPRLLSLSSIAAREPHLSDYSASKAAADAAVMERTDLAWTILRPPAVYGPGDRETLRFFQMVKRGMAPLPHRHGRVSLIHVKDLARAVVHAVEAPSLVGIVTELDDGASGGYGWQDLVSAANKCTGGRAVSMVVPAPLLRSAAVLGTLLSGILGRTPALSVQKVRELLHLDWTSRDTRPMVASGWRPTLGIEEGFEDTVAWYQQQGWM
jgi:nucleoside-diphosphate-sugar epimerase